MSCPHGNSIGYCDICDEIDAAWKDGEASGKRSAEHCTCPACRITHANDCAVHNMPAMPAGPCDCGAIQAAHPSRSGVVSDEDVRDAERYREFCRQASNATFPTPILLDAFEMGSGVLDMHLDAAMEAK